MINDIIRILIISFTLSHLVNSIMELLPDTKLTIIPKYILMCKSCSSFYISLILSGGDLFTSSVIWIVMFLYSKLIEPKIDNTIL